jgi:hypothetical protein
MYRVTSGALDWIVPAVCAACSGIQPLVAENMIDAR